MDSNRQSRILGCKIEVNTRKTLELERPNTGIVDNDNDLKLKIIKKLKLIDLLTDQQKRLSSCKALR